MAYEIITETSANLTKELIDRYKIKAIPLIYLLDGEEFIADASGENANLKDFYDRMRKGAKTSTSCISHETFTNEFEKILKKGKDVIFIGLSSGISGTMDNAFKAAEELKKKYPARKIFCVDSLCAAFGQGRLVVSAFELKEKGKSVEEVYDFIMSNRLKLIHLFTVDDLKYLYRGGRLKKSSYILATALNIKPVMHVDDEGRLKPLSKAFGRKSAIVNIASMVAKQIVNPEEQVVYIIHADCLEDAEMLKARISGQIKVKDFVMNITDSVIGAHSGPGTLAVFFYGEHR